MSALAGGVATDDAGQAVTTPDRGFELNGFRVAAVVTGIGCLLAVVGAIGPWVKAFAVTVSGLDGSNDGWIVLVLALFAAALVARGVSPDVRERRLSVVS